MSLLEGCNLLCFKSGADIEEIIDGRKASQRVSLRILIGTILWKLQNCGLIKNILRSQERLEIDQK